MKMLLKKMAGPLVVALLAVAVMTTGCVNASCRIRGSDRTMPYDTVVVPNGMVASSDGGELVASASGASEHRASMDGIRTRHEREKSWNLWFSTNPLGWICGDGLDGGRTYVTAPGQPVWHRPYTRSVYGAPIVTRYDGAPAEPSLPEGAVWDYIPCSEVTIERGVDGRQYYCFFGRGHQMKVPVIGRGAPVMNHNGVPCYRFWFRPPQSDDGPRLSEHGHHDRRDHD